MILIKPLRFTFAIMCALLLIPATSHAEILTIHGVNPEMDTEEVLTTLRSRSRHCNDPTEERLNSINGETYILVFCWSLNTSSGDHSDISVSLNADNQLTRITFECGATGTCGMSRHNIVQALVNHDILPEGTEDDTSDVFWFSYQAANGNTLNISRIGNDMHEGYSIDLIVNEERYRQLDF